MLLEELVHVDDSQVALAARAEFLDLGRLRPDFQWHPTVWTIISQRLTSLD